LNVVVITIIIKRGEVSMREIGAYGKFMPLRRSSRNFLFAAAALILLLINKFIKTFSFLLLLYGFLFFFYDICSLS
jgi:hypothetical protein